MKNLTKHCTFQHTLSLDCVKYFITGELSHAQADICNLYEMRYTETREQAEAILLKAEETLLDMEHFWKDATQSEFDEFIDTWDTELQNML